jgi:hypothetical protein
MATTAARGPASMLAPGASRPVTRDRSASARVPLASGFAPWKVHPGHRVPRGRSPELQPRRGLLPYRTNPRAGVSDVAFPLLLAICQRRITFWPLWRRAPDAEAGRGKSVPGGSWRRIQSRRAPGCGVRLKCSGVAKRRCGQCPHLWLRTGSYIGRIGSD